MNAEAVVITGIGMVTPLGSTRTENIVSWKAGNEAVRTTSDLLKGTVLESQEIALLPRIDPARLKNRKMMKFMSEAAALGCVAAHEALEEAQAIQRFASHRIGLFAATGLAAIDMREAMPMVSASIGEDGNFSCRNLGSAGLAAANPLLSFKILANMPPCLLSIIEKIKGLNLLFTPWEGQAGAALKEAWHAVASGEIDCALAGGADNSTLPTVVAFLRKMGILRRDEYASAGAGYVVMERLFSALKDNRHIYTKIIGIDVTPSDGMAQDPLSRQFGRTFAAAPALLLGLAAQIQLSEPHLTGTDLLEVEFRLEKMA